MVASLPTCRIRHSSNFVAGLLLLCGGGRVIVTTTSTLWFPQRMFSSPLSWSSNVDGYIFNVLSGFPLNPRNAVGAESFLRASCSCLGLFLTLSSRCSSWNGRFRLTGLSLLIWAPGGVYSRTRGRTLSHSSGMRGLSSLPRWSGQMSSMRASAPFAWTLCVSLCRRRVHTTPCLQTTRRVPSFPQLASCAFFPLRVSSARCAGSQEERRTSFCTAKQLRKSEILWSALTCCSCPTQSGFQLSSVFLRSTMPMYGCCKSFLKQSPCLLSGSTSTSSLTVPQFLGVSLACLLPLGHSCWLSQEALSPCRSVVVCRREWSKPTTVQSSMR